MGVVLVMVELKRYRILVRETNYVAYFVDGESVDDAHKRWANNGYECENNIVDSENDILEFDEITNLGGGNDY